jgi:hypothetical protein
LRNILRQTMAEADTVTTMAQAYIQPTMSPLMRYPGADTRKVPAQNDEQAKPVISTRMLSGEEEGRAVKIVSFDWHHIAKTNCRDLSCLQLTQQGP